MLFSFWSQAILLYKAYGVINENSVHMFSFVQFMFYVIMNRVHISDFDLFSLLTNLHYMHKHLCISNAIDITILQYLSEQLSSLRTSLFYLPLTTCCLSSSEIFLCLETYCFISLTQFALPI